MHPTVSFGQQEPQPLTATPLPVAIPSSSAGFGCFFSGQATNPTQQPTISINHVTADGCFPSLGLTQEIGNGRGHYNNQQASFPSLGERRVTIWNKVERRKISGNAAPMGKNVEAYLRKHPECEVFTGQDKSQTLPDQGSFPVSVSHVESLQHQPHNLGDSAGPVPEKRVTIWHTKERRKISGNAAPMGKNLASYLKSHPDCEVYVSQDKDGARPAYSTPLSIPESVDGDVFRDTQDLTPVDQLSEMENLLAGGIPISPVVALRTSVNKHLVNLHASPVSPLDSIPDSFPSVMEFSIGSHVDLSCHKWSINSRTPEITRKVTASQIDKDHDSDEEMGFAQQPQDEFCVLGQLEGL